jgi:hypothetical protein
MVGTKAQSGCRSGWIEIPDGIDRQHGPRLRAQALHDSPYAKGNFSFERVICDWRTRIAVLDLRLKK